MSDYEIDILVRGRPIRQFKHNGDLFVEGRKGSNFELKFTNNTWNRVEVVSSVDGLSVMDGKLCGTQNNGYLVPARESIIIPGWRLNNNSIAKFIFKGKEKSYSTKSGYGTDNVGAIGFMVFKERTYALWNGITNIYPYGICGKTQNNDWMNIISTSSVSSDNIARSVQSTKIDDVVLSNTTSVNMASSNNMESDNEIWSLGVGFGDEDSHQVQEISFTRENQDTPNSILTVYYDDRKGLETRGIEFVKTKKKSPSSLPNPFPTYSGTGCVPPPGWNRRK